MTVPEAVLRAPLVPLAVAATVGVVTDRVCELSWPVLVAVAATGLIVWVWAGGLRETTGFVGLALSVAALGAVSHHFHRHVVPADDLRLVLTEEPQLARLRGRLHDEPMFDPPAKGDPLRSVPEAARTHALLDTECLIDDAGEHSVSGRVALTLTAAHAPLHAGDELEVTGWLSLPRPPDNPGERDYRADLFDQGISAVMIVRRAAEANSAVGPTVWS